MRSDDVSSVNAKLDFVIGRQDALIKKVDFLQSTVDRSKGAITLIKFVASTGAAIAAWWAFIHGAK